jgi:hypothetical protein
MALAPINPLHKERSLYLDLTCHPGDLAIPNAIFLTLYTCLTEPKDSRYSQP